MADEIIGWDGGDRGGDRSGLARSEVAVEKEDLQSPTNRPPLSPSLSPSLSSFHAPQLRSVVPSPIRRLFITNLSARFLRARRMAVRAITAADYVQAPNVFKFIILVSTRSGPALNLNLASF